MLRRGGAALLTLAVAVGSGFAASLIAHAADGGSPAAATADAASCDRDGVSVGYDVRYESALAAYGVSGVRVVGIAPACDGATLQVALADASGNPLPDGTLSTTVDGDRVDLPVPGAVAAAAVKRVYVSLEGRTQIVPPAPPPTTTTAPPPPKTPERLPLPVAPSLCPTVTGAITVTGTPATCGSVVAAPTRVVATTLPVAVASWGPGVFPSTVEVTLSEPVRTAIVPPTVSTPDGNIVQLSVVDSATRQPLRTWNGVLAIDFPPQPGPFLTAYSEDGRSWSLIPPLSGTSLPAGQPDGYVVRSDGLITVFTRHATLFAVAPPPSRVGLVHAKLLPTGGIRLTWTPSSAGLGVAAYRVLRDGRAIRTVDGATTIALVPPLPTATYRFAIAAVDSAGTRSLPSAAVALRVPLIVGAARGARTGGLLRARIRLTGRATVRVLVLDRVGRRLTILPGSVLAGARASRVGRPTAELRAGVRPAGAYALTLRLQPARPARGPYRVVVLATAAGRADRAEIRFR